MANLRFHEKYHGTLHHTLSSSGIPGSGTDPIASKVRPFVGDFYMTGGLSAAADTTILGDLALGMNASDSTCRLALTGGTTQSEGIQFGTDTFMYRSSANYLRSSGSLHLNGDLVSEGKIKIWTAATDNQLSVNTEDTDGIIVANTNASNDLISLKVANTEHFRVNNAGITLVGPDASYSGGTTGSNAELIVGNEIMNSSAIAQFDGFVRLRTGLYISRNTVASDEIGLEYDNTNKGLRLVNGGTSKAYFGIGMQATMPLQIRETEGTGVPASFESTHTSSFIKLSASGGRSWIGHNGTDQLELYVGGDSSSQIGAKWKGNLLGLDPTGVTHTPTEALHVKDGNVFIEKDAGYLKFKSGSSSANYLLFNNGSADAGSITYSHSDNSFSFQTNSTERMRINSAGRVIIKDPTGANVTGASSIIGSYVLDVRGPVVQSTNAGNSFYSIGFRRSGSSLTSPDIYDMNGHGLVLSRASSQSVPTVTISQSMSGIMKEGVGINMAPENGRALCVSGNALINGDLDVVGSVNYSVGSVTIQDPVIQLGTADSDTAADGYDRGCMIVYDNDNDTGTAAISGFFGMERDSHKFVYYSSASFDTLGNNASSTASTLGSMKMASIEATTQIYSYGGLRVDDNSHLNSIKECSTADITTLNTSYIKPLTDNRLYLQSNQITLQATSSDSPTVAIGRDASLVNSKYDLYVHKEARFNSNVDVRNIHFINYAGGVSPNSNNSNGNLFLMVNGGSDSRLRHATPLQTRQGLGLSDAATTSVADIRAPLLKTAGGDMTGKLRVYHNNYWAGTGGTIQAWNQHVNGAAFEAYTGEKGMVLISRNTGASNAKQFSVRHHSKETHIIANRAKLRIGGNNSVDELSSTYGAWHLLFDNHQTAGLHWSNGSTAHTVWHSGNLDPQAYGVHTLQPLGVKNGILTVGNQFKGETTGTVTLDQHWLDSCVIEHPSHIGTRKVWSSKNHGSGSGLNADMVDNLHASSFVRTDATSTLRTGFKWTTGKSHTGTTSTHQPWNHYAMYREGAHAGDNPYRSIVDGFSGDAKGHAKLAINWHRGINIRADQNYGGIQFYRTTYYHSMMEKLAFSIGRGNQHVRTHGASQLRHLENDGTEYKYLHEGNMGSLVNANTFDGQDSVDFMKKHSQETDAASYSFPSDHNSALRQKKNGFYNTSHKGYSGMMLSWGTAGGSTSRVQLWTHYHNDRHLIRTSIDNNRWTSWTRIWTENSLKNLSQLSNDKQYVRYPASGNYEMDQTVNKGNNVQFNGVTANWFSLHSNVGYGIEIANDKGNQFIRFDNRENTYRAAAHRFQARDGHNVLYVDHNRAYTGLGAGRTVMYGTLEFRSSAGAGNDSDPHYIYKHRHSSNTNELRMVIGDNRGKESFSIWDSAANGAPEFCAHRFHNNGNAEHYGTLYIKGVTDSRQKIGVNRGNSHGTTYHMEWGLYNPTGSLYIEPQEGKSLYIVPDNWSQSLTTHIYGKANIGGPGSGWGAHDRGLSVKGNFNCQSTIRAGGDIISYYSDRRLKKNLKQLNNSSEIIKKLTGYKFDWNNKAQDLVPDDLYSERQVGLIAQDVEDVLPEAVTGNGPRDLGYKTIKYDKLVPVLVEALKEEMSKTEELEARLERLEKLISNK